MSRWEYETLRVHQNPDEFFRELQALGDLEWEAFAVIPETDTHLTRVLLKRPKL